MILPIFEMMQQYAAMSSVLCRPASKKTRWHQMASNILRNHNYITRNVLFPATGDCKPYGNARTNYMLSSDTWLLLLIRHNFTCMHVNILSWTRFWNTPFLFVKQIKLRNYNPKFTLKTPSQTNVQNDGCRLINVILKAKAILSGRGMAGRWVG